MRYRYITCGLVSPEDRVAVFRLIAGNKLSSQGAAIRITIPNDLKLQKYTCDDYSTCENEDLRIKDCCPVLLVRINGRFVKMPTLWPQYQPHAIHEILVKQGWRYDLKRNTYLRRS